MNKYGAILNIDIEVLTSMFYVIQKNKNKKTKPRGSIAISSNGFILDKNDVIVSKDDISEINKNLEMRYGVKDFISKWLYIITMQSITKNK